LLFTGVTPIFYRNNAKESGTFGLEWCVFIYSKGSFLGKKLYAGNLSYNMADSELEQLFGAFGTIASAKVIVDRDTGRSKGFGFVEMESDQEAQAAISELNGKEIDGRALNVNEARPKTEGGGRGGYGGGGRGNRY
jgi:RNA recognition motif-containing protein